MSLAIDRLSLDLAGRRVLDGVEVAFAAGRVTVVLGPNGAGKSSLLGCIAGLHRHAGEIRLDGQPLAAMDGAARARAIGYLPQAGEVHWNIAARALVALGRLPHRSRFAAESEADRVAIDRALAAADAAGFAERPVGELSGGERARVLLARVLAGEPRWLLADEPLASLDPAHQHDIARRLRAVAAGGAGVVLVLHDLALAARYADDVLLIDHGRVAGFGTAAAMLTPDRLRALYGVETARVIAPDGAEVIVTLGA